MSAHEPAEASRLFERLFAAGDLDALMALYEDDAVFPTPHGTSTGQVAIRATLKAYLDSGAQLAFGESLEFLAGDRDRRADGRTHLAAGGPSPR